MNKTRCALVAIMIGSAVLGSAVVSSAADQLVYVENLGDKLVFHPQVEFNEMILTVTGPCDYQYRQVVDRGELAFRLSDETIDGAYTFNVTFNTRIDEEVLAMLKKARKYNDETVAKKLCREGRLPGPPPIQSGGFWVDRSQIVFDPDAEEKPTKSLDIGGLNGQMSRMTAAEIAAVNGGASTDDPTRYAKDYVINDDLIVDGSACVGFDCVNGESFGFDTIRLKENNLRIKFDDTSVAAAFPRNDWQLTANDSANGGASKFSIDDISGNRTPFTVEANARSHSLYVDDGGRIGSRTSTPSVEIHTIDGDTPTLRLQQDGSSGFAPQTWDVAGNETNFFVRDVTNGSTLPFRIRPSAPSSSIYIDTDGSVGIGTSSPDDNLEIFESADDNFGFRLNRNSSVEWVVQLNKSTDSTAPDGLAFTQVGTGVREMELQSDGDLYIQGNFYANGVQLSVPDYVFSEDYNLMPLDQLRRFVGENSHLPRVSSAEEIKLGGLNMTAMQLQLLEKVEELTLYTLQQDELINGLHSLASQQQEAIEMLRAEVLALQKGEPSAVD